jgi:hypothetical protein
MTMDTGKTKTAVPRFDNKRVRFYRDYCDFLVQHGYSPGLPANLLLPVKTWYKGLTGESSETRRDSCTHPTP